MEVILICVAIAVVLFVSAFIHKRRFGLLGLALAAGSLLSSIWGYDVGLIASGLGIASTPMTTAIILSLLILLPSGLLLFHGYTYNTIVSRAIGASLFTLLALAFLVEPLGHILILQGAGATAYQWLVDNKSMIIGAGLTIAVLDLFLTKPPQLADKRHKH